MPSGRRRPRPRFSRSADPEVRDVDDEIQVRGGRAVGESRRGGLRPPRMFAPARRPTNHAGVVRIHRGNQLISSFPADHGPEHNHNFGWATNLYATRRHAPDRTLAEQYPFHMYDPHNPNPFHRIPHPRRATGVVVRPQHQFSARAAAPPAPHTPPKLRKTRRVRRA